MALEATSKHLRNTSELALLIPIKPGFVEKAGRTTSYAMRLRNLLEALTSLFPFNAELSLLPSPSVLEMLQNIFSVQYAVVDRPGRPELLVSVTFDSSWEAYFQNLVDNVGALLDLVFSHCEDADGHRCQDGYEAFTGWIRRYQLQTSLYYSATTDLTVDDLRGVRLGKRPGETIPSVAELYRSSLAALRESNQPGAHRLLEVTRAGTLRLISVLADLRSDFEVGVERAKHDELDARTRFDRAMVELFREIDLSELAHQKLPLAAQELWALLSDPAKARELEPRQRAQGAAAEPDPDNVQGDLLREYVRVDHGCLVMVQSRTPAELLCLLRALEALGWPTTQQAADSDSSPVRANVGFTFEALSRSGLDQLALASFPREFREGMRARAGLLGDIGPNHPENWQELEVNWEDPRARSDYPLAERVPVGSIDVVISLQKRAQQASGDDLWNDRHPLWPSVNELADALAARADAGPPCSLPRIVHVEPLRRRRADHFSLTLDSEDRFESQPSLLNGLARPSDNEQANQIPLGELLLGYPDRRGKTSASAEERPGYPHAPLFRDGTFLVLRKLEQDVDEFVRYVSKFQDEGLHADDVRTQIVGRDKRGRTLAAPSRGNNDFNYRDQGETRSLCPAHSHARRTNPRYGRERASLKSSWEPRILRRSMSYGALHEPGQLDRGRGLMFFAYNASIAQQFEVVQRWVSGGNSTSVSSSLSDLMLGVHAGGPTRYPVQVTVDGVSRTLHLTAPEKPFVTLRWGMYLFVPARAGLMHLRQAAEAARRAHQPDLLRVLQGQKLVATLRALGSSELARDAWKQVIEEDAYVAESLALWSALRASGAPFVETPYGRLVSDYEQAAQILSDGTYSVSEYRRRMRQSMGLHYLGLDPGERYQQLAKPANGYLIDASRPHGSLGERAFEAAQAIAQELIAQRASSLAGCFIDLKELAVLTVATLADRWVGLPDGTLAAPPLLAVEYMQHFIHISRYCFLPYPSDALRQQAEQGGLALRTAYRGRLANSVMARRLRAQRGQYADEENVATAVIGAIVGFAAPAVGNILSILARLNVTGQLEALARSGAIRDRAQLSTLVRELIIQAPQPPVLYRSLRDAQGRRRKVVIGLHSVCMSAPPGKDALQWVFGGDREGPLGATHGCPARELGQSAIEGVVSAVLACRTLRAQGVFSFSLDGPPPQLAAGAGSSVPPSTPPPASSYGSTFV